MKITLARDLSELDTAVAAIAAFFDQHSIDPDILYSVELALEELFVNLVRHNNGTHPIDVAFETHNAGIRVTLTDRDVEAFDPTAVPSPDTRLPAEQRRPGGLGIHLTGKLVDSLSYDYHNRISKISFTKQPDRFDNRGSA